MINKVEYNESSVNNDAIASDSFYHQMIKTGNNKIIDEAIQFYSSNPLTNDLRYSAFRNKIISIKNK